MVKVKKIRKKPACRPVVTVPDGEIFAKERKMLEEAKKLIEKKRLKQKKIILIYYITVILILLCISLFSFTD